MEKLRFGIIGASGISLERGITTPYPMHTALQRKIIEASKVRLLAVDHSKFDKIAAEKVAELSEMDKIITDSGLRKDIADKFSKHANLVII
jgi:DeoR/GlpR family transcriptional regulator of sugar metabolism